MAHFAKLDENNNVIDVVVVNNEILLDENGNENEQRGIDFLTEIFGNSKWVQTSYNSNFRYNYAGIGGTYDKENDAFILPKPFASWSLDESYKWKAPIALPNDGNVYAWSEKIINWVIRPGEDYEWDMEEQIWVKQT